MANPYFRQNVINQAVIGKYGPNDLVFSDEFNNPGQPDKNKWRYEHRVETNPGILGGQYKYQAGLNRQTTNSGIAADGTVTYNDDGSLNRNIYTDGQAFCCLHGQEPRKDAYRGERSDGHGCLCF